MRDSQYMHMNETSEIPLGYKKKEKINIFFQRYKKRV